MPQHLELGLLQGDDNCNDNPSRSSTLFIIVLEVQAWNASSMHWSAKSRNAVVLALTSRTTVWVAVEKLKFSSRNMC